MEFRWLEGDEIVNLVNPVMVARGWAALNVNEDQPTCRVLGAFDEERLVEVFAFQLYPVLGPLLKIDPDFQDSGKCARELADRMRAFMNEVKARGCLAVADSPVTTRLCERFGMTPIGSPVYSYIRGYVDAVPN